MLDILFPDGRDPALWLFLFSFMWSVISFIFAQFDKISKLLICWPRVTTEYRDFIVHIIQWCLWPEHKYIPYESCENLWFTRDGVKLTGFYNRPVPSSCPGARWGKVALATTATSTRHCSLHSVHIITQTINLLLNSGYFLRVWLVVGACMYLVYDSGRLGVVIMSIILSLSVSVWEREKKEIKVAISLLFKETHY